MANEVKTRRYDSKVKVIVKRPDEPVGHVTNISTRLENLQLTVGGYIETLRIDGNEFIICNEEAKPMGLPKNFRIHEWDNIAWIYGTVIVAEIKDGEIVDLPDGYFKKWKGMLWAWGNN